MLYRLFISNRSVVRPRRPCWPLATAARARDSEGLLARGARRASLPCFPFPHGRTVLGATARSKRGVVAGGCIGIGSEEALRASG
jgi:hypothetical protein